MLHALNGRWGIRHSGELYRGQHRFTCVTDMQIMLTVQTSEEDPQTHAFITETKSFLNISSRNVFAAYIIATTPSPTATLLQPTPPGLPLTLP